MKITNNTTHTNPYKQHSPTTHVFLSVSCFSHVHLCSSVYYVSNCSLLCMIQRKGITTNQTRNIQPHNNTDTAPASTALMPKHDDRVYKNQKTKQDTDNKNRDAEQQHSVFLHMFMSTIVHIAQLVHFAIVFIMFPTFRCVSLFNRRQQQWKRPRIQHTKHTTTKTKQQHNNGHIATAEQLEHMKHVNKLRHFDTMNHVNLKTCASNTCCFLFVLFRLLRFLVVVLDVPVCVCYVWVVLFVVFAGFVCSCLCLLQCCVFVNAFFKR